MPELVLIVTYRMQYIVNGALKQVKNKDGTITYDMSNEDYLQDFDMFQQAFSDEGPQKGKPAYSDLAGVLAEGKPFEANVPYPTTRAALEAAGRGKPVPGSLDLSKKQGYETKGLAEAMEPDDKSLHAAPLVKDEEVALDTGLATQPEVERKDVTGGTDTVAPPVAPGTEPAPDLSGGTPPKDKEEAFPTPAAAKSQEERLDDVIKQNAGALDKDMTTLEKVAGGDNPRVGADVAAEAVKEAERRTAELIKINEELAERVAKLEKEKKDPDTVNAKQIREIRARLQKAREDLDEKERQTKVMKDTNRKYIEQVESQRAELARELQAAQEGNRAAQLRVLELARKHVADLVESLRTGHERDLEKARQDAHSAAVQLEELGRREMAAEQAHQAFIAEQEARLAERVAQMAQQNNGSVEAGLNSIRDKYAQDQRTHFEVEGRQFRAMEPEVRKVVETATMTIEETKVEVSSCLMDVESVVVVVEQVKEASPMAAEVLANAASRAEPELQRASERVREAQVILERATMDVEEESCVVVAAEQLANVAQGLPMYAELFRQAQLQRQVVHQLEDVAQEAAAEVEQASKRVREVVEDVVVENERAVKGARRVLDAQERDVEVQLENVDAEVEQLASEAQKQAQEVEQLRAEAALVEAAEAEVLQEAAQALADIEQFERAQRELAEEEATVKEAESIAMAEQERAEAAAEEVRVAEKQKRRENFIRNKTADLNRSIQALLADRRKVQKEREEELLQLRKRGRELNELAEQAEQQRAAAEQAQRQAEESSHGKKKKLRADQLAILEARQILERNAPAARARPRYERMAGAESRSKSQNPEHFRAAHVAQLGGGGVGRNASKVALSRSAPSEAEGVTTRETARLLEEELGDLYDPEPEVMEGRIKLSARADRLIEEEDEKRKKKKKHKEREYEYEREMSRK